jgi:hypothetical protein
MPLAKKFSRIIERAPSQRSFDPLAHTFAAQAPLISDEATFVSALCGRRSGKTEGALLRWHLVRQRRPGLQSVFIALTGKSAKSIAWRVLKAHNQRYSLGLSFNESELVCTDAKGSTLQLLGANREDLLDAVRGFPIQLAVIDEAAFYRLGLLKRLLEEVLEAALVDYGGQLLVVGTPGLTKVGHFFQITAGKEVQWSRHHWTMLENPNLPAAQEWLAVKREKQGWGAQHPVYVREYLGEWSNDASAQVYPIDETNIVPCMPDRWTTHKHEFTTILGIDYGVRNATAHVVCAYSMYEHCVYVVDSRRDTGMLPTECNSVTERWQERYRPVQTVGDAGGLGKVYVESANVRGGLGIEAARKLDKRGHQEWVRDALGSRPPRLLICDVPGGNRELIEEMQQLQWEPCAPEDPRYHTREDPRGKKDLCDAMLYAYVCCHDYFPVERPIGEADPDDLPKDRGGLEYLM